MRLYPRADIEIEGGSLMTIFDISVKEENGAQQESTYRKAGNGISFGSVKMSVTFKVKEPSTAAERDWRDAVRNKRIKQLVVKYPDASRDVVDGAFSSRDFQSGLEGAAETTLEFVGFAA